MEADTRLDYARGTEDGGLIPGLTGELDAEGQALGGETDRHADGGPAERVEGRGEGDVCGHA